MFFCKILCTGRNALAVELLYKCNITLVVMLYQHGCVCLRPCIANAIPYQDCRNVKIIKFVHMCVSGEDQVPPQAHSLSASVFRKSPSESCSTQQGGPATQWHNTNSGQSVGHLFFLFDIKTQQQ